MTSRRFPLYLLGYFVFAVALMAFAFLVPFAPARDALERKRASDSTVTAQAERVARVDTVARVDSVRLVAWRTRWDTVRVRDTVVVNDTVYVRRDVADSTIRACTDTSNSCTVRVAERDKLIADLKDGRRADSLALETTRRANRRERLKDGLLGMAAGVVLRSIVR